jgi:prepilin-type N-terminal cleavage/methylation domain-containing protein
MTQSNVLSGHRRCQWRLRWSCACRGNPDVLRLKSQSGFSLIEVVIAIAIIGIVVAGLIPAMMTVTRETIRVDHKEAAKNLAEGQMEYVKGQTYESFYHPSTDILIQYPNFTVDDPIIPAAVAIRDSDIQAVTIVVRYHGLEVTRLTGYKLR